MVVYIVIFNLVVNLIDRFLVIDSVYGESFRPSNYLFFFRWMVRYFNLILSVLVGVGLPVFYAYIRVC